MYKLLKFAIGLILINVQFALFAQSSENLGCGTIAIPNEDEDLDAFLAFKDAFNANGHRMVVDSIAVQFYIVRSDNGSGGLNSESIEPALEIANSLYSNSNLFFYQCNQPEYIDNSSFLYFNSLYEAQLVAQNYHENVINIYVTENVRIESTPVCGYAYMAWSNIDVIVLDDNCVSNGSTLNHELGHFFGLYHTHEVDANGPEYVNGSNCSIAGDLLCDTPADPLLGSNNVSLCDYNGNETDPLGDYYSPDETNIMAYSPQFCRDNFTDDQYARIAYHYQTYKTHLSCDYTIGSRDLIITNLSLASNEIGAGTSFSYQATIKNIGEEKAYNTYVRASISPIDNESESLEMMSFAYVNSIDPGESQLVFGTLETDPNFPGNYFFIAKADGYDQITESQEDNNISSIPVVLNIPEIDFELFDFSTNPSTPIVDNNNSFKVKIKNIGEVDLYKTIEVRAYLSEDNVWDYFDETIGYSSIYNLAKDDTLIINIVDDLENEIIHYGDRYVVYKIDERKVLVESNEDNNIKAFPIYVSSGDIDYYVDSLTLFEDSLFMGEEYNSKVSIGNSGSDDGWETKFNIYISEDEILSEDDLFVVEQSFNGVDEGEVNYIYTGDIILPNGLTPGLNYFIISADVTNQIEETNELNNSAAIPFTVATPQKDFNLTHVSLASSELSSGSRGVLGIGVEYNGSTFYQTASLIEIISVLSDDNVYSDDDNIIARGYLNSTYAGEFVQYEHQYTLPNNISNGQKFIITAVDVDNEIAESNEVNNVFINPITIGETASDFNILSLTNFPSEANLTLNNLNFRIEFTGGNSVYNEEVGLYLSADSILDESDLLISNTPLAIANPNSIIEHKTPVNLPIGATYNDYNYYLAKVDLDNSLSESNELNNVGVLAFTDVENMPVKDYRFLSFDAPPTVNAWSGLSVNSQIELLGGFSYIPYNPRKDIGVFISVDEHFDPTEDKFLGSKVFPVSTSDDSNPLDITHYGNINLSVLPGDYFLIGVIDYEEEVDEINELNNIAISPITVLGSSNIDLELVAVNIESQSNNFQFPIEIIVKNNSDVEITNFDYQYFLSINGTIEQIVSQDYNYTFDELQPGETDTITRSVYVNSSDLDFGNFNFVVNIDPYNNIEEVNETNNSVVTPILIDDLREPDLDFVSVILYLSTATEPGDRLGASIAVKNIGTTSSVESFVSAYFSLDNEFDESDDNEIPLIGNTSIHGLSIGEIENSQNLDIYIPSDTPLGNHFIFFKVESPNNAPDLNFDNNIEIHPITIIASNKDIVIESISEIEDTLSISDEIIVTMEYKNLGSSQARKMPNAVFLSNDNQYSSDDILVSSLHPANTLMVNNTIYTSEFNFKVPDYILPGNFHLVYFVDYTNYIGESNELNNYASHPITLLGTKIDVVIDTARFVGNNEYTWDEEFTIEVYTENIGTDMVGANCQLNFYYSKDMVFDDSDELIGQSSIPNISANGFYFRSFDAEVSYEWEPGQRYIILVVDGDHEVHESNENNNHKVLPIIVNRWHKDFTILSGNLNKFFINNDLPQDDFGITLGLANLGDGHPVQYMHNSRVYAGAYFSDDEEINSDDEFFLNIYSVSLFEEGERVTVSRTLEMPKYFPEGPVNLISKIDYQDQYFETNESNNTFITPCFITDLKLPDFRILDIKLNQTYSGASGSIVTRTTYGNFGTENESNSVRVQFYYSNDSVLDSNDDEIGNFNTEYLLVLDEKEKSLNIDIPDNALSGNRFIIAKIDSRNSKAEIDESNNIVVIPFFIEANLADMEITDGVLNTDELVFKRNYAFNYNAANIGNVNFYNNIAVVGYISDDEIVDENDYVLFDNQILGLDIGQIEDEYESFTINEDVPTGQKYFIVMLDGNNQYNEIDEVNNLFIQQINVKEPQVNLKLTEGELTESSIEIDGEFRIRYIIENIGNHVVEEREYSAYLSEDTILDIGVDRRILQNTSIYNLQVGNSVQISTFVDLSQNLETGVFNLLVFDYPSGLDTDIDSADNKFIVPLEITPIQLDVSIVNAESNKYIVDPGSNININYSVKNLSPWTILSAKMSVYLSVDSEIGGGDDRFLFSDWHYNLDPNQSDSGTGNITINNNVPPGDYKLIFKIDSDNDIDEFNEDNNYRILDFKVNDVTSVDLNNVLSNFEITPNPSDGIFFIHSKDKKENLSYKVFNLSGQLIQGAEISVAEDQSKLQLEKGIYFIYLFYEGKSYVEKLIVQ